jgi:pantoate--beta-alanine ligase
MEIIHDLNELRAWRRSAGQGRVVLVPTMGALHAGHTRLVEYARQLAGTGGRVGVSIFVNPLQFGPKEDFGCYPRELESDAAKCKAAGADCVYAPSVEQMYEPDRSIIILEQSLSKMLCGASRPGHFDGVCTVVAKLFNAFTPDDAVFGKKDFQQLAIIRRMVRDLNWPVQIHGMETVREEDGLAMSSRNRYLNAEERAEAAAIQHALRLARDACLRGELSAGVLRALATDHISKHAALGRIDYLELVHAETLQPLDEVNQTAVLAAAVFFEKARLIDNIELLLT